MGNNNTREARRPDTPSTHGNHNPSGLSGHIVSHFDQEHGQGHPSRSGRGRSDLLFLGLNSASNIPPERRETKQEREARKLEKERQARVRERERSLKEESVDGGYLVTMGVYTGPEDFNKAIVRQLIIERRMAPFWRGLSEFSESWNENQLIAAARGLPVPDKDDPLRKVPTGYEMGDLVTHSDQSSCFPKSPTTNFPASDTPDSPSTPNLTFIGTAPHSSPMSLSSLNQPSSQIRPRSKTLASLTNSSQFSTSTEIVPREIHLPKDPYVNGKTIEVFLYKDAIDCPICFLSYPPYLNKTRCCDQPVCSECFVQIKRPDPHPPEHHDPSDQTPQHLTETEALVSEPACCPYCQQPEFGVTYEPPMFRRGLCFANAAHGTSSSISDALLSPGLSPSFNPATPSSHISQQRRTTSISANSSTVITTDRIRPDWATKLANARSYLARSSAAATALHTAAYLMGNSNTDTRGFAFRANRLSRNRGASASVSATSTQLLNDSSNLNSTNNQSFSPRNSSRNGASSPRNRVQDIEELMMMEAIRLSIAAEEDRKKKAEKEALKEVKKKAKEDKKREKKERKSFYGSIGGSASGSALNLSLPGLGRGRGNSAANLLHQEVASDDSQGSNYKGKGIENQSAILSNGSAPIDFPHTKSMVNWNLSERAQFPYQNSLSTTDKNYGVSPTTVDKAPHPCLISDTSSPTSSFDESNFNTFHNNLRERRSSRLGSNSAAGKKPANFCNETLSNDSIGANGSESSSNFNFRSLAAMIGDEQDAKYEKGSSSLKVEDLQGSQNQSEPCQRDENVRSRVGEASSVQRLGSDYSVPASSKKTPELIITPGSPDAIVHADKNGQTLGKKSG
ncbi:hypothetical protein K3495_g8060 [Podosphaera aphanis]|nr:hypothetical protein K3495_g8060 [Podosphaera aphanis]